MGKWPRRANRRARLSAVTPSSERFAPGVMTATTTLGWPSLPRRVSRLFVWACQETPSNIPASLDAAVTQPAASSADPPASRAERHQAEIANARSTPPGPPRRAALLLAIFLFSASTWERNL